MQARPGVAVVAAGAPMQKVIKARSLNGPIRWRDIAEGRLGDRAMNAPNSSRDLTLRAFILAARPPMEAGYRRRLVDSVVGTLLLRRRHESDGSIGTLSSTE